MWSSEILYIELYTVKCYFLSPWSDQAEILIMRSVCKNDFNGAIGSRITVFWSTPTKLSTGASVTCWVNFGHILRFLACGGAKTHNTYHRDSGPYTYLQCCSVCSVFDCLSAFCASPMYVRPTSICLLGHYYACILHFCVRPLLDSNFCPLLHKFPHQSTSKQSLGKDWKEELLDFQSVSPSKPPRESAKSNSESGHRRHHHHHHKEVYHHPQSSSSNNSSSPESTVCLNSSRVVYISVAWTMHVVDTIEK